VAPPPPEGAPGSALLLRYPELKALERYFDSQKSFQKDAEEEANLDPILEKAKASQLRRRRRELEHPASAPGGQERGWP
jgi:hypothetical protein